METLKQFLKSVYTSLEKRSDSYLELGLALASAEYVESVVALSESPLYRRKYSSVYDCLTQVSWTKDSLLKAKLELFAETCEELAGYEVYSGDSTFIQRSDAKTLEGRVMKRLASGALVYGHESYWTTRLSDQENSWSGVALVEQMTSEDTVTKVAGRQMKALDAQGKKAKLFVFDAGHGLDLLEAQQDCQRSDIILRLKSHQVFYHEPTYKGRGRPPKHGPGFKLSEAADALERQIIPFKKKRLRISSYTGLHARKYPDLKGKLLKLEFLDDKDKPVFTKPIWLFTTAVELNDELIARAYLWRSSHELTFRFMKQHLALTKNQSPELTNCEHWLELVALAMNLLLASRTDLRVQAKPWYPHKTDKAVSQRQAQKQALSFFLKLPAIIQAPQPAGKAPGRAIGFSPPARNRHPVIRKTPKRKKACPTCPFKAAA